MLSLEGRRQIWLLRIRGLGLFLSIMFRHDVDCFTKLAEFKCEKWLVGIHIIL